MPGFDQLVVGAGFLVDTDIENATKGNCLIVSGTAEPKRIRHSSYELRLGEAHVAPLAASKDKPFEFTIRELSQAKPLKLSPGDIARLYSIEVVSLPANVVAFTVARGLLFVEGLTPENTYVDPGFTGKLYTTVVNHSNRVVTLDWGMPITRLFFFKLHTAVKDSYSPGNRKEIDQQVGSEVSAIVSTPDEARKKSWAELIEDARRLPMAGNQIAELVVRENQRMKWGVGIVGAYVLFSPFVAKLIEANPGLKASAAAFGEDLVAKIFAALIIAVVPVVTWLLRLFGRRNGQH